MTFNILVIHEPGKKPPILEAEGVGVYFFPVDRHPADTLCGLDFQLVIFAAQFKEEYDNFWIQSRVRKKYDINQKTIDDQREYIVQLETELKKCADEGVDYV